MSFLLVNLKLTIVLPFFCKSNCLIDLWLIYAGSTSLPSNGVEFGN